eukprot:3983109-Alexandrium_andersonii.AAC.1
MPELDESAPHAGAALMPLQEGRKMKPEFEGFTKLQVAIDAGVAASVIPERLLEGRRAVPSEGPKKGVRYLPADGGGIPDRGEVSLGLIARGAPPMPSRVPGGESEAATAGD